MIFSKDIRKICAFCVHSSAYTEDELLCEKHGPVPVDHSCRRFKYDALKRIPEAPAAIKKVDPNDLKL